MTTTTDVGAEMLHVVREVYSVANAEDQAEDIGTPGNVDLTILDDLAAEHFDAPAFLERLLAHAYRH